MRKLLVLGLLSLGMAGTAAARQHNAVPPSAPPPAMHAMPAAPVARGHVTPAPASSQVHPATHVAAPGAKPVVSHKPAWHPVQPHPPLSSNSALTSGAINPSLSPCDNSYPVPGSGFDYTHFFAVHPNSGACNPVSGVLLPFIGGGGFYVPVSYNPESSTQTVAQETASNEQPDSNGQASAQEPAAASRSGSYPYSYSEPLAEYIFVKRDGSAFFAVAYTLLKDKLQYVTKEGLRRIVPLDSIDLDATQKFNEERGNTIILPNRAHPA